MTVDFVRHSRRGLALASAIVAAAGAMTGSAYAQHHHHGGGISTGAAVGLGLGAFALGSALGAGAYGSPYGYGYYTSESMKRASQSRDRHTGIGYDPARR